MGQMWYNEVIGTAMFHANNRILVSASFVELAFRLFVNGASIFLRFS